MIQRFLNLFRPKKIKIREKIYPVYYDPNQIISNGDIFVYIEKGDRFIGMGDGRSTIATTTKYFCGNRKIPNVDRFLIENLPDFRYMYTIGSFVQFVYELRISHIKKSDKEKRITVCHYIDTMYDSMFMSYNSVEINIDICIKDLYKNKSILSIDTYFKVFSIYEDMRRRDKIEREFG